MVVRRLVRDNILAEGRRRMTDYVEGAMDDRPSGRQTAGQRNPILNRGAFMGSGELPITQLGTPFRLPWN